MQKKNLKKVSSKQVVAALTIATSVVAGAFAQLDVMDSEKDGLNSTIDQNYGEKVKYGQSVTSSSIDLSSINLDDSQLEELIKERVIADPSFLNNLFDIYNKLQEQTQAGQQNNQNPVTPTNPDSEAIPIDQQNNQNSESQTIDIGAQSTKEELLNAAIDTLSSAVVQNYDGILSIDRINELTNNLKESIKNDPSITESLKTGNYDALGRQIDQIFQQEVSNKILSDFNNNVTENFAQNFLEEIENNGFDNLKELANQHPEILENLNKEANGLLNLVSQNPDLLKNLQDIQPQANSLLSQILKSINLNKVGNFGLKINNSYPIIYRMSLIVMGTLSAMTSIITMAASAKAMRKRYKEGEVVVSKKTVILLLISLSLFAVSCALGATTILLSSGGLF